MQTKHQFRARVKNINYDYLEDYQIVNDYSNIGETLDAILEEHKELKKNNWNLHYIAHSVANVVNESISNELNRIRLGTNNTDRNTQVIIELVQGFMQMENLEHIPTTDIYKPTFLTATESVIQDRITHQKQRKHS
ncbi:hypothetical protein MKY34_05995 [Sporosarcina sp. FSL K6-1522]|uniref:hypothetical protein n=1 Tax=Sporosarcina sp. FSL K6-1522 TaxID=2921554 RepID=UPI00315A5451